MELVLCGHGDVLWKNDINNWWEMPALSGKIVSQIMMHVYRTMIKTYWKNVESNGNKWPDLFPFNIRCKTKNISPGTLFFFFFFFL